MSMSSFLPPPFKLLRFLLTISLKGEQSIGGKCGKVKITTRNKNEDRYDITYARCLFN